MAHDEEKQLLERKEIVERELKLLLLPKDPNDDKNVIVEIRAGTGGDEAALFAAELFPHVLALRGNTKLESRNSGKFAVVTGWTERSCRRHRRQQSVFQVEIRKRRAPRAASSCNRNTGPHSHFRSYRSRPARSRRH